LAHTVDSTCEYDVRHSSLNLHTPDQYRLEAGAASTIHLDARNVDGKTSIKCGDAPDSWRFAVWIRLPEQDVVDLHSGHARLCHDGADHRGRERGGR
jgi:hypothetical protein